MRCHGRARAPRQGSKASRVGSTRASEQGSPLRYVRVGLRTAAHVRARTGGVRVSGGGGDRGDRRPQGGEPSRDVTAACRATRPAQSEHYNCLHQGGECATLGESNALKGRVLAQQNSATALSAVPTASLLNAVCSVFCLFGSLSLGDTLEDLPVKLRADWPARAL